LSELVPALHCVLAEEEVAVDVFAKRIHVLASEEKIQLPEVGEGDESPDPAGRDLPAILETLCKIPQ
jgi:hypothetical protein